MNSLEEGKIVMHHSNAYRWAYDPHYRIVEVRAELFKALYSQKD